MQTADGHISQLPNNLWEFFLKNHISSTAFEASREKPGPSTAGTEHNAFTIALVTVLIIGGISLYLVRPTASGESVTVRCERSAVIAAGDKKDSRKERKLTFERCMDESLQTWNKPAL